MTLNEIEQRLEALQAENDKLIAELERLKAEEQSKEVKPWRAEYSSVYHTILGNGMIHSYTESHDSADSQLFHLGNYYRTRELAEQDAKELALRSRVRQLRDALCEGYQFKHGKASFCIFFDGEYYRYSSSCNWCLLGTIYFDTAEHAQQACDILNAERRKESGGNG